MGRYGPAPVKGFSPVTDVFRTQTMKTAKQAASRMSREPGFTPPRGSGEYTRSAAVRIYIRT
ncbi:MAG: hypothetical protein A3J42_01290 [Candidatus Dadabacteria bacterium RIFCSPHIGHO2_12_FULL_53_21]|nr:MAG: hypothetical protein A3J42_01290 [Candidatus Dadabacteria bacterium RIFCSPHIGHO2_12_FULL_53_21]